MRWQTPSNKTLPNIIGHFIPNNITQILCRNHTQLLSYLLPHALLMSLLYPHPSNHSSGSPHYQTGRTLVAIWLPHTSWMIDVRMHRWLVVTDCKDKDFLWTIQTFLWKNSYKTKIAPKCDILIGNITHDSTDSSDVMVPFQALRSAVFIKNFTLGPGPSSKFLKDTLSRGLALALSFGAWPQRGRGD